MTRIRQSDRRIGGPFETLHIASRVLGWMIPALLLLGSLAPAARAGEEAGGATATDEAKATLSTAPDFTLTGIDGKTYQLKELLKRGPVLLDFWTTWCKPCMLELPQLQKIYDQYKERGFTLLGVVSDDQRTAARIKPTIQSKGFKFPNAPDPGRTVGNLYNVRNYPTSVLIAPNGGIVIASQGYKPGDEKELEQRILGLLPDGADKATSPSKQEVFERKSGGSN